jgi:hypothetical protein
MGQYLKCLPRATTGSSLYCSSASILLLFAILCREPAQHPPPLHCWPQHTAGSAV